MIKNTTMDMHVNIFAILATFYLIVTGEMVVCAKLAGLSYTPFQNSAK